MSVLHRAAKREALPGAVRPALRWTHGVIVEVDGDGNVSVTGVADLRSFKIVSHLKRKSAHDLNRALNGAAAGRADASHGWVKVDWLRAHSGISVGNDWNAKFDQMLEYARSAGYLSPAAELRGHVLWVEDKS